MERHLTIIQTVKILSLSQYRYSDTSFNTNLNIQDKVRWQFCDLKPLHSTQTLIYRIRYGGSSVISNLFIQHKP